MAEPIRPFESAPQFCVWCERQVQRNRMGRFPLFCSSSCRSKAWRFAALERKRVHAVHAVERM